MTFSISTTDREKLLDRFPVTDVELDQLLPMAAAYDKEHAVASFLESYPEIKNRIKATGRKLVQERIGRLFEATRGEVFLLGFDANDALYNTAQFLEACMVLLGRRGDASIERALWEGGKCSNEENKPTANSLGAFIHALVLAVEELSSRQNPNNNNISTTSLDVSFQAPQAWISSIHTEAGSVVSCPEFRQWISNVAPTMPFVLSTFFHWFLLDSVDRLTCPWSLPVPPTSQSLESPSMLSNICTAVPLVSMGLHGYLWKPLYQSTEQGLSYHTLQLHLTSFFGPTILILRSTNGDILGYYTEIPWKITSAHTSVTSMQEMTEGKDAFLFTLHPVWRRFGRTLHEPKGRMVQYLHGTQQKTNPLSGISVGGIAADTPRLHIETSLEKCKAVSIGRCFQDGPLLGSGDDLFFNVEEIQLYAVAPDVETLVAGEQIGRRVMETKEALRQKMAQVDKKQFVDDLIFMPGHLFAHREQTRGRAEFVADDDEGRGYYIDGKPPSPHVTMRNS